jgi:hypothetical protein
MHTKATQLPGPAPARLPERSRRTWTAIALTWLACLGAAAQTPVTVTVNKNNVLQSNFGGLGFNVPVDETVDAHTWNTVVGKRLKEVSVENYVRVFSDVSSFAPAKGVYTWNSPGQQAWDRMMTLLKANGTDVFVTNGYWGTQPAFLGGNREITNADTLADWAEVQLAGLNQWINVKGRSMTGPGRSPTGTSISTPAAAPIMMGTIPWRSATT